MRDSLLASPPSLSPPHTLGSHCPLSIYFTPPALWRLNRFDLAGQSFGSLYNVDQVKMLIEMTEAEYQHVFTMWKAACQLGGTTAQRNRRKALIATLLESLKPGGLARFNNP